MAAPAPLPSGAADGPEPADPSALARPALTEAGGPGAGAPASRTRQAAAIARYGQPAITRKAKPLSPAERAEWGEEMREAAERRPRLRSECFGAPRPCPYVACRFHLYLDVNPRNGHVKYNFPGKEPWELDETCALDVVGRGGATLEEVGLLVNLTRERVRQVEARAIGRLEAAGLVRHLDGHEFDALTVAPPANEDAPEEAPAPPAPPAPRPPRAPRAPRVRPRVRRDDRRLAAGGSGDAVAAVPAAAPAARLPDAQVRDPDRGRPEQEARTVNIRFRSELDAPLPRRRPADPPVPKPALAPGTPVAGEPAGGAWEPALDGPAPPEPPPRVLGADALETKGDPCDHRERDALVRAHAAWVERVAVRLARRLPPEVDRDDLASAGREALVSAAARYRPGEGVAFQAFAYRAVWGAMIDSLRAMDLPRGARALLDRLEEGGDVTDEQAQQLERQKGLRYAVPLDTPGVHAVAGGERPDVRVEAVADVRVLLAALEGEGEREREMFVDHYVRGLSLDLVGVRFGVTGSRVSQLLAGVTERLAERLPEGFTLSSGALELAAGGLAPANGQGEGEGEGKGTEVPAAGEAWPACPICGRPVGVRAKGDRWGPKNSPRDWCEEHASDHNAQERWRTSQLAPVTRTCKTCGQAFTAARKGGMPPRYCSDACRAKVGASPLSRERPAAAVEVPPSSPPPEPAPPPAAVAPEPVRPAPVAVAPAPGPERAAFGRLTALLDELGPEGVDVARLPAWLVRKCAVWYVTER